MATETGLKNVTRDFKSSGLHVGITRRATHVNVLVSPSNGAQRIELWTDRGTTVTLTGQDVIDFIRFWKGFETEGI